MKYSNVNKEFSTFYCVENWTVDGLRKEIKKMTELKEHYQKQLNNTIANTIYYYDLWEFFAERKLELEKLLVKYENDMIKKERNN